MIRSMILLALLGMAAAWSAGYQTGGYMNNGYSSPIIADQDSPYHITSDAFESNRREFFSPRYNTNSRSMSNYYYPRNYNYGGGNYSPYYDDNMYSSNKYGYDQGRYRPNRYGNMNGYGNGYSNYGNGYSNYGGYGNGYSNYGGYGNGYNNYGYNNYHNDYGYDYGRSGGRNNALTSGRNSGDYWSYSQTPRVGKGGYGPSNAYRYY
eukprot:Sro997_g229390.2  (207) ;mRNA; f:7992-9173